MQQQRTLEKFGWFTGVFLPTFLTIIGVIFFLRLGFVVGAAGIGGAVAIILVAESVVVATAVAISQISKREVGPGGAFALIGKTLGDTVGGAVGIPLFFAQAFSVPFYIFGFAEAWQFLFPQHSLLLVALIAFAAVFLLTFIDIDVAIKAQIGILGLIVLSLLSIFGTGFGTNLTAPLLSDFATMSFWKLFALFFPAVTGVLAGIGLSGQLKDPKNDITKGNFWAIGITAIIYVAAALWLGLNATPEVLLENTLAMMDNAAFPSLVIVGVLAASFSSGLVTLVAASRLLQAMSHHNLVPCSHTFAKRKHGEPRNAIFLISALTILVLLFASLDKVAFLLTIFFLIAYGIINAAFLRKYAKSFTTKVIAIFGILASFGIIPLINFTAGLLSLIAILGLYFWIRKRETQE